MTLVKVKWLGQGVEARRVPPTIDIQERTQQTCVQVQSMHRWSGGWESNSGQQSFVIAVPLPSFFGKVYEKRDLACIIKKYNKNALRLICYNFRTVNAINFLFSTLHTAPFLYGKIHFGVLHLLLVSIATFDTPLGSNPP